MNTSEQISNETTCALQIAKDMTCTLTIQPSWEQFLKMAQYASDMQEPLRDFILEAIEQRCAEIDKIREDAAELSPVFDQTTSE